MQFVKQLLQRGNRVIAGVRTPDKAQALSDLQAHREQQLEVLQLDVQDMDSIAAWGHNVAERTDCADVRNTELPCSLALRCLRRMIWQRSGCRDDEGALARTMVQANTSTFISCSWLCRIVELRRASHQHRHSCRCSSTAQVSASTRA